MAQIIINVSDVNDASEACREVASAIDAGYTNGLIGWSADDWYINE